jgi:peptide/nickel transport system permease protein
MTDRPPEEPRGSIAGQPIGPAGPEGSGAERDVLDDLAKKGLDEERRGKARTPWQIFWKEFRKSRTAMIGAVILILLYGSAIFADFLSPYSMKRQNRDLGYVQPYAVHLGSEGFYVYNHVITDASRRIYQEDKSTRFPIRFFVKGPEYEMFGLFPMDLHLLGVDEPGEIHLLGTDEFGRDQLSRLLFGARVSLSVGLVGIALTFFIGTFIGGLSGYFGGWIDEVVMRVTELIMSIPVLYLIVALAAVLPPNLSSDKRYLLIIVILSFVGWASLARIVRGIVLSLREFEYVTAARALGAGTLRIIFRHIIPNTMSFLIVASTISVPAYILGEVSLSFLGVGIQEPVASWGNMLTAAQKVRVLVSFPWILIPGLLIFITVLAFNFLGDGLADALNPRKILGGKGP